MAERRMFHVSTVGSDRFMDLPVGAQALYFHLGMQADNDGFVNGPKQVARRLRRPPRELQALVDEGFLLEFDGIVVLKHWLVANTLRSERTKMLNHPNIARQLYITENKEYSLEPQGDSENLYQMRMRNLADKCHLKGKEEKRKEEKRIEKKGIEVSGEETADADAVGGAHPRDATEDQLKQIFGKLGKGVVYLSDKQTDSLLDKLGLEGFDYYVNRLSDYIVKNDAKISNHYATILRWWEQDKGVRA